jgi:hypothetical protein
MRSNRAFLWPVFLAGCLGTVGRSDAETDSVPSDFKLFAQYGPGYSDWKPWKLTITADGKAVQEAYTYPNGKETILRKTLTLTKEELQQFVAKVRDSRFYTLAQDYSYKVTDNPTLILRVTMNGKSHEVTVYAPHYLKNKDGVKRFSKIWNEVLRKVPSPNSEQKPE